MLFIPSLRSTAFTTTTIKGISKFIPEKINHRWRIKVIKFVNSTVKCNVNFIFLQNTSTWNRLFLLLSMNARRLWNESSNFMQHRIKSDLVISQSIVHSYGIFFILFLDFSLCHFSITLPPISAEKCRNFFCRRGWIHFRLQFLSSSHLKMRCQPEESIENSLTGMEVNSIWGERSKNAPFSE